MGVNNYIALLPCIQLIFELSQIIYQVINKSICQAELVCVKAEAFSPLSPESESPRLSLTPGLPGSCWVTRCTRSFDMITQVCAVSSELRSKSSDGDFLWSTHYPLEVLLSLLGISLTPAQVTCSVIYWQVTDYLFM